jgi:hypothetical protein
MADRKTEIVESMQNLARKASELAVEHTKTIEEYHRLKTELETIRHSEATKGKARRVLRASAEM